MLRLKQIDIFGFKSFCHRERLRFPGRGIAAVVGPNGCGKSNICDATNWVLGEQSAKSLRGSRMHDVIFNGTSTRKPAGLATVTLTLQDPQDTLARLLGADRQPQAAQIPPGKMQGEVAVTRKLFRSGESQYIINGKVVRLRDVQNLFLGSGLGPNHYAIIEQGRIGQLLSSRPLDRRAFVEEAAGVTRFKAKRKLAELKLSNASLNLERVHDILQEVQRQGDSLKRQAARAERYERYRQELREALSLVFAYRYRRIEAERTRLETASKTAAKRLRELSAETERMEAEFSAKRTFEQRWEAQLETERDELAALRIEGERLRERVAQQSRAAASNESRCEQAARDLADLAERLQAVEEDLVAERQGLADMAEAAGRLRRGLDAQERECGAQDAAMANLLRQQEACRVDLLQTLHAISSTRARLERLDETLSAYSRQVQGVRTRREDAAARLGQAAQQRTGLEAEAHKLGEALAGAAGRRRSLQDSLETRRSEREALRKDAEAARAEVSRLTAKRDSLRELLAHRAYAAETVQDIFDSLARSPRPDFQPLGILADFLEVDEGLERIVEQFLGDELEYVVVGSWREARCGLHLVREEFKGQAAFFVRGHPQPVSEPPPQFEESTVRPLRSFVRLGRGRGQADLPKVRTAYLVDDAQAAEALADRHPHLCFVLPDGRWYRGNTLQAGRPAPSGPLVLKQQLRELGPQLQRAEDTLVALEADTKAAEVEVRRLSTELEAVRGAQQNHEKQLLAIEHKLRQSHQISREMQRALDDADREIRLLRVDRSARASQREEVLAEHAQLKVAYAQVDARAAALAAQGREGRALAARLHEDHTKLRTEGAALAERHRAGKAALAHAESQLAELTRRQEVLRHQIDRWRADASRLAQENEGFHARLALSAERQQQLLRRIADTSKSLQESRAQTAALVEAIRARRSQVEAVQRQCSAKEVELARAQAGLVHLIASCTEELGEPIEAVAAKAPEDLDAEALGKAEERHRRTKEKIQRLGPVNVLAREEFARVSERLEFLESQQQDLLDAIRNTLEAIRELATVSRERFDAAFEAINVEFRRVFASLFDGGLGEMRLTDPANPQESGIDIVAQPAGKRLRNVALLSGGEKSLTVMALLMATFRYKPSPFCILDEVDAQLDEANTIRFRKLLQEMAPETQFIVITHSKTTMEVAEALYGVTMGEAGVSKLVSVRMGPSLAIAAHEPADGALALTA